MAGDGAVGGLVLIVPLGAHQHGGHHGQRPEGRGDHIAHHVAVVVLEGPDHAAFGPYHPGHGVVDQGIEVGETLLLELRPVLLVIEPLEGVPEGAVIFLGDGVLGGEPQVLICAQGIVEAAPGKGLDGGRLVVLAGQHAVTLEVIDCLGLFAAKAGGHRQLRPGARLHLHLRRLVHVAVGMAGDGDGLLPGPHHGADALHQNRRPEHRAVQNRPDGAVGALPHLVEVVFRHPGGVGGDGGAFDAHAQAGDGLRRLRGDLVPGGVPIGQAQVVVFGLQVHKGGDEDILDVLPQDPGHLVPVHLHQGRGHFDLFHGSIPPIQVVSMIIVDFS